MSSELTRVIDRLVEEKTFGLDALAAIKDLRDKAGQLETENEAKRERINALTKQVDQLEASNNQKKDAILRWSDREQELIKREDEARNAIFSADKEKAVSEAYKDILHTIFKPPSVREMVQSNIPVMIPSGTGYGHVEQHQQTESVVREEL